MTTQPTDGISYNAPRDFRASTGSGAPIVSMIRFDNRTLIATTENVYEIKDGCLEVMKFVLVEDVAP